MMMIVLRLLSPLLSLRGLKPRWHRHFRPRPLNEVFFQGGRVAGFVDSWPESLVPSASNRSTLEWTLVDSLDSRQDRFDGEQLRAKAVRRGSTLAGRRPCPWRGARRSGGAAGRGGRRPGRCRAPAAAA